MLLVCVLMGYCAHAQTVGTVIGLPEGLMDGRHEFSGMCVYGDEVFLLQQSAYHNAGYNGSIYSIGRAQLSAALHKGVAIPEGAVKEYRIVNVEEVKRKTEVYATYEGFEAIAISNGVVYLTIETTQGPGFIVKGAMHGRDIRIDMEHFYQLPLITRNGGHVGNAGYEGLAIMDGKLLVAYEFNYLGGDSARMYRVDTSLTGSAVPVALGAVPLRITDITPYGAGKLLAVNFFFHREQAYHLPVGYKDADLNGWKWNADCFARILEIGVKGNKATVRTKMVITKTDCNNWEGIVPFEQGVLLINDEYLAGGKKGSRMVYVGFGAIR